MVSIHQISSAATTTSRPSWPFAAIGWSRCRAPASRQTPRLPPVGAELAGGPQCSMPLAPIRDDDDVVGAIAATLGVGRIEFAAKAGHGAA